jgi:hypothetical protein
VTDKPRVILLAFDGFPLCYLRPSVTPNLWRLGAVGGFCLDGGRSGLPSTTYPAFASLLTGLGTGSTRIRTTSRRDGAVPGWAGNDLLEVPTIVHVAEAAGLRTAVVMGDDHLARVLRFDELDRVWPQQGIIPEGTERDAHGYPTNAAIRPHVLEAAADSSLDLVFIHMNETDTLAHDLGPGAKETEMCARAADAIVGEMVQALRPDWRRTLIAVVSDHDMVDRLPLPPIDPTSDPGLAGLIDDWIADGCAAWLRLAPGVDRSSAIAAIAAVDGIEGWRLRKPDTLLLLASPGRVFAAPWVPVAGIHGSTCTARTLAMAGGGHHEAPRLASAIRTSSPHLRDWAPTLACVLGIDLPRSEGVNMLRRSAPIRAAT